MSPLPRTMVTYRSYLIAREGWLPFLGVLLIGVVLIFSVSVVAAMPFFFAAIIFGVIFRDPKRLVPPRPLAIVNPVDGKIIAIDKVSDPYTGSETILIQTKKRWFDVASLRSPIEGKVVKQWFGPVSEANGDNQTVTQTQNGIDVIRNSNVDPYIFAQWVQSDEQDDVVMVVKPVSRFFRPRCYAHAGERVGQGQRCGTILFGASINVYVPVSARLEVQADERVNSGSDTLAVLVHTMQ